MEPLRFHDADVGGLPAPGWYVSMIVTASWRQSTRGNRMVYLVHALEKVSPPFHRISDCFVLEGVSPQGQAYARQRIVAVFRSCRLDPRSGEEIRPEELCGLAVEVKVAHESWRGENQLKVVGYRPHEGPSIGSPDRDQEPG